MINTTVKPAAISYLGIVGCPQCKRALISLGTRLHCTSCQISYGLENGIPALLAPSLIREVKAGQAPVKNFYLQEERYDWTKDPRGLEFAYHHYRKWQTWKQISRLLKPESVVLDLGCGTGLITRQFTSLRQTVVAVDLNLWALSQMDGKPWLTEVQGDGESLPIQGEAIDLVVVTEMLEHLEAPDKAVTEIFRVCKKGGRVVGSVPSTSHIWRWRRRLSMTCGGGEPFHRNFTWNEISDLWRQAGFRVCIQQSCLGLNWMFILEKP